MDPNRERKDAAEEMGNKVMKRLKVAGLELSEYENIVAADVIDPADLTVTWDDVGGLDKTIEALQVSTVYDSCHGNGLPVGVGLCGHWSCSLAALCLAPHGDSSCRKPSSCP